jgi:hypothetical protein
VISKIIHFSAIWESKIEREGKKAKQALHWESVTHSSMPEARFELGILPPKVRLALP